MRRTHIRKRSYDLFSNYDFYLPGFRGMLVLLLMFLIGVLAGNAVAILLKLLFQGALSDIYTTLIVYPVQFIPAMLYASAMSRREAGFVTGKAVDGRNFGRYSAALLAMAVSFMTIASAFLCDGISSLMPPMPEMLQKMLEALTEGPVWATLLSVSVFAPFFEEWLCRGMIQRGLMQKHSPATAIAVSAAFFAIIHMNPWQAVPAFLLGLLFGYVYYRTGSLKLTMLMHCVNNTLSVILSRIPALKEAENFTDILSPWAYALICIACIVCIMSGIALFRSIPQEEEHGCN